MTRTPRKARLSDVAQRAGVSATTASYILNGRSAQMRIATETQERVLAAAAALRYRPNPSARNLRTATTRTIGVISDVVAGGPFASALLTGASSAARRLDHFIVIGESQGDPALEELLIEEMLDQAVDGLLYVTMVTSEVRLPAALAHQRVVLLNCVDRSAALPAVLPDEYQGGRTAADAVLECGATDEIFVIGERPAAGAIAGELRLDGIKDELRSRGLVLSGQVICDWNVRPAYDAVSAFLADGARPQALICLNDRVAMGCYQALADHGLRVPDDVSIVSFDGSELAHWLRPEVTSVALPYAELGARAVELLLDPEGSRPGVVRMPMPIAPGGSVRGR